MDGTHFWEAGTRWSSRTRWWAATAASVAWRAWLLVPIVPNPPPQAPPGPTAQNLSTIIGYIKYGSLAVIVATGLAGVGAVAVSKAFQHPSARNVGLGMLLAAFGAAVLYASIYAIITGFTG